MPSMSITIERTPLTLQWEGQEIQVEQSDFPGAGADFLGDLLQ